jgi:hypothetical protein
MLSAEKNGVLRIGYCVARCAGKQFHGLCRSSTI